MTKTKTERDVLHTKLLHALALRAEEVIHSGDVAEIVAMPPGTTGLTAAVDARDRLYEEPAAWIRDQVENLDQILATPEAREEPTRGQLSEFLMALYDHGTNPNALREADAILHFLGRRAPEAREVTDAEVEEQRVLAAARVLREAGDSAYLPDVRAALEAAREVSR